MPARLETRDEAYYAERKRALLAQFIAKTQGETAPPGGKITPSVILPTKSTNTQVQLADLTPQVAFARLFGRWRPVRTSPLIKGTRPRSYNCPQTFLYHRTGKLPALARPLSPAWEAVLPRISTTSLRGGQLRGNQGRNLVLLVNALRRRAYLRVDANGQPLEVREVTEVVIEHGDGGGFITQLPFSRSTFYEVLHHPLAHLFIRTQKVQVQEPDGARRNVGTRLTVALYDPPLPEVIDQVFEQAYAEAVDAPEIIVLAYTSEVRRTRSRPKHLYEIVDPVETAETVDNHLGQARKTALHRADIEFDQALQPEYDEGQTRQREDFPELDPELKALAQTLAIRVGEADPHRAWKAYYKALLHLGAEEVKRAYRSTYQLWSAGKLRKSQGAYLTGILSHRCEAQLGRKLSDLPLTG
ncbi:hypothetical protein [Deinococcus budaensis]|uniref:Uncharacterized protein n=1 Tax=Deinococcus budaensis TaxID=1665626 RepID=A0A7W8LRJ9_9DEIO|nr:hypothetical protein [Deinococcus budaensis]MBB5235971.1 hypothetical protein [Deinococcus budaensis]